MCAVVKDEADVGADSEAERTNVGRVNRARERLWTVGGCSRSDGRRTWCSSVDVSLPSTDSTAASSLAWYVPLICGFSAVVMTASTVGACQGCREWGPHRRW